MGKRNDKRIIYSLCVADIQEIADEKLSRELTPEEQKFVEDHVGDYIAWRDAIDFAIDEMLYRQRKSETEGQ